MTMGIRGVIFLVLIAGLSLGLVRRMEALLPGTQAAAHTVTVPAVWQSRNAIRGLVTDTKNRPLERLRVELKDEVEMTITQTYTDSLGRYAFYNLTIGTFIVKVNGNGVYAARSARVTLIPARAGGGTSHLELLDFTLLTLDEARGKTQPVNQGVTFVQEVPEPARKAYEKAVNLLEQKKMEEGVETLKEALKLFTNYFLAWERLGVEYIRLEHYQAAHFALNQAVKINQSGHDSLYALGYAQFQLRQWHEAAQSLSNSLRLAPTSPNAAFAHYYLGLSLLKEQKPGEAEVHLKQARTLGQNNIPAELHWHLAQLYSTAKRYREAADELEVFLKRAPSHAEAESIRNLIKQLRGKEKNATAAPVK